jgi:tRNA threonylcarbamoyladenosine biosynthesis protein TsaE
MASVRMWQLKSVSQDDTERFGELLGKQLKGGEVIELCADLGGGKTTYVRGLARGVGSKDIVSSPTFTLNKIYKGREGLEIHHFDFYRLDEPGVVADQLAESLDDPKVVTVVEWSDIVEDVLPEGRLVIEFHPVETDPDERAIHFHYPEKQANLIRELETKWTEVQP